MLRTLWSDESGQTLIEYGLLAGLLGIVCITILVVLGRKTSDAYVPATEGLMTSG